MPSFSSLSSFSKSVLINCSLFFYSCSRVPTVPELDGGPQIFSNFPSFSNLFQSFVNFLPLLSFQYAASSKLFPRKQLRRSSKVFTLPLDYTHRLSLVSIATYNCLHSQELCSCNVPKITKSTLKKWPKALKSIAKHQIVDFATCSRLFWPKLLIFAPAPERFWGKSLILLTLHLS